LAPEMEEGASFGCPVQRSQESVFFSSLLPGRRLGTRF
jgi:hypothetical protein